MRRSTLRISAGSAIIVGSWCFLYFFLEGTSPPLEYPGTYEASGRLMAQQALSLLAPGGQLAVIARDTAAFKNLATDIQLKSFCKTIDQAHVAIFSLHKLQADPLRPITVPSGEFCDLIRKTPDGCVIVSFMGPPNLTAADRSRLGKVTTPIVAFCSGKLPDLPEIRALFQQGLLKAAVVDRRGAGVEQSFLTLTSSNLPPESLWQEAERRP